MVEKGKIDDIIGSELDKDPGFTAAIEEGKEIGVGPSETKTAVDFLVDRSTKITIPRTDLGCMWAYENDNAVASAIDRLDSVLNNGFDVLLNVEEGKNPSNRQLEAQKLIEDRVNMLTEKVSSVMAYKTIIGWAVLKKTLKKGSKDIRYLVPLDASQCTPIVDSYTGKLGGKTGKGLDDKDKNKEIALVQKGKVRTYQANGEISETEKTFYFTRDEIIPFSSGDRGKFKGTSPVKRILRLVEIKKSLENTVELIVRRFGPQICVIIGNDEYNLAKADIPPDYLRDSEGNPVARATARKNYKTSVFSNIQDNVKKWADGDTLIQVMEYGVDIKTINPAASPFDYARYIDLFSNYIKIGILGLYVQGRVDITSAVMQERLMRDLRDKAKRVRMQIEDILNKEYVDEVLVAYGYKKGCVYIKFKQIDRVDDQRDANVELLRSQTIRNYMQYVGKVPDYLLKKWSIEEIKDSVPPNRSRAGPGRPVRNQSQQDGEGEGSSQ